MKNIYITFALIALFLTGCGPKMYSPYSDSLVISHPHQGSVVLLGVSDELDKKDGAGPQALRDAHKKAIQQLFYQGFIGTDFKNPMIKQGISVETKHKDYFDAFWNGGYQKFITTTKADFYNCESKKNCISAVSEFTLNYNMLRQELEANKIINKIGF